MSDVNIEDLQVFPAIVVEKVIKALKLNSNEARLKFPRLLQIVEKYPERILGLMTQEVSLPTSNTSSTFVGHSQSFVWAACTFINRF